MLKAYGLYGHIRNNAIKSAMLLAGFVVLTIVYWCAWCIIYTAVVDGWWSNSLVHRVNGRAVSHAVTVIGILDAAARLAMARWWIPIAFSAVWFILAYLMHAELIRAATGARALTRKEAPKLYNTVETLAIGAGLPMPRIEVIYTGARNAFASGLGRENSCITVTTGLLHALGPDELEAVLAHEMTHIRNNDIQLMVVATVFAGGLTLVGDAVVRYFSSSSENVDDLALASAATSYRRGNDGGLAAVLVSIAIGVLLLALTHIFSLVIKFALSRTREFLADAGAVELTKNPDALISALQKISGNDDIPGLNTNLQAMMISAYEGGLFSTHPPIATRIMALQQFAGGEISTAPRSAQHRSPSGVVEATPAGALGITGARPAFGRRGMATG